VPHTSAQRVFVVAMMLLGASMYGYLIGAVSALLASAGERHHHFITTMNKLNHFMENRMLPSALRCQLRHYFRCACAPREATACSAALHASWLQLPVHPGPALARTHARS
jgi:hypothetical protein